MRLLLSDVHTSGGASTHTLLLARQLVQRGHEVTAHLGHDGPRASSWASSGARVVTDAQLLDRLLSRRYDVVNLTEDDLHGLGRAGVRACRSPVVVTVHASPTELRADGVDHVVTVSAAVADHLRLRGGRPPVRVIPNPVDGTRFCTDGPVEELGVRPVALWVGRVNDWRKDVATYLQAVRQLGPGWRALVVADPRQRRGIDAFRIDHPEVRVETRAWEDMAALYRGAARTGGCLVVSSRQEGDPLVVGEALGCGLPVAVVGIPAVRSWMAAGAVAVADAPEDLADAVRRAVGPARGELLDRGAHEIRAHRSLERWTDDFEAVHRRAAERGRPRLRRRLAGQLVGERRLGTDTTDPGRPAAPQDATRLGIVVTTFERPGELAGCLDAVAALRRPVHAVCVVDNSLARARGAGRPVGLAPAVRFGVLADGINRGLPAALGRGFDELADCDRVLVLDDDTRVTDDLVRALDLALDRGADLAGLADRFSLRHNGAGPARLVAWSPSLLRRQLIDDLGSPDAQLFFGFDDYEYSRRAQRAGWRVEWVRHELHGRSLGDDWPERRYFAVRNSVWLATRGRPPDAPSWTIAGAMVRRTAAMAWRVARAGGGAEPTDRRAVRAGVLGLADGLRGRMGPPPAWVLEGRRAAPPARTPAWRRTASDDRSGPPGIRGTRRG